MTIRLCTAVFSLLLLFARVNAADKPTTIDVWPGAVPGEKGDIPEEKTIRTTSKSPIDKTENVSHPTLSIFKPEKDIDTGTAVLICPGGGYNILAFDLEGTEVAAWLNKIGVTGIVLKYRVPRRKDLPKHLAPLQDVQRSLGLIRSHAAEWGIDPQRLGILGFSAGGHLSATASTNYQKREYEAIDDADKLSCRPDFTVLIYPAYLAEGEKLNPELPVTSDTPPAFLAHANDDGIVPQNSVAWFLALKRANVPAELHIYATGGHGFGLRTTQNPSCTWPERCEQWMKGRGLLKRPTKSPS